MVLCILYTTDCNADDWIRTFSLVSDHIREEQNLEDLSDALTIEIPEPDFAYVNITGVTSIPLNKTTLVKCWMEVYDGNGHYFKKRFVMSGQGGYSIRYVKRNFTSEFSENDWTCDKTTKFVIGDWVEQDAFHFKAFYTDFIRGIGEIGYKLFDDIVDDRLPYWERGGYYKQSKARCFPDGFPCAVYLNNEFYGVYAWQLKKNHNNMNQKNSVAEHIHLDGNIRDTYLFMGNINWSQFEVRSPKDLYTSSNKLYDGNSPSELLGSSSVYYNLSSDTQEMIEDKQRTAQVKDYIVKMSKYWNELGLLDKAGVTNEEFKKEFEKRYDIDALIDYYVFFRMLMNGDGTVKNWQWFTYDGVKWMVTPYDLDQTFGLTIYGFPRPATHTASDIDSGPFHWINKYYVEEERARYFQLRDGNVLCEQNILNIIRDWYYRIGEEYYTMEKIKWPDSPCYCEPICNIGWEVCDDWSLYGNAPDYLNTTLYNQGDVCKLDGRLWRAVTQSKGVKPYIRNTAIDTLDRLEGWVTDRINFLDNKYGYVRMAIEPLIGDEQNRSNKVVAIYTLSGMKISEAQQGINIYRYEDGTSRKVIMK